MGFLAISEIAKTGSASAKYTTASGSGSGTSGRGGHSATRPGSAHRVIVVPQEAESISKPRPGRRARAGRPSRRCRRWRPSAGWQRTSRGGPSLPGEFLWSSERTNRDRIRPLAAATSDRGCGSLRESQHNHRHVVGPQAGRHRRIVSAGRRKVGGELRRQRAEIRVLARRARTSAISAAPPARVAGRGSTPLRRRPRPGRSRRASRRATVTMPSAELARTRSRVSAPRAVPCIPRRQVGHHIAAGAGCSSAASSPASSSRLCDVDARVRVRVCPAIAARPPSPHAAGGSGTASRSAAAMIVASSSITARSSMNRRLRAPCARRRLELAAGLRTDRPGGTDPPVRLACEHRPVERGQLIVASVARA